jgi:putative transposase
MFGFDYRDDSHAYFVTMRALNGSPFVDENLAREVIASLHWLRENRNVRLYAYSLMPDHLHLLLQLPSTTSGLSATIGAMKRFTTQRSRRLGHQGQLWQTSYHDRIVRRADDGAAMALYIVRNPERAGLVKDWSDYPWNGLPDPME